MQPWNLLSNNSTFIFAFLGVTGAFLGSVAGVLVAEYWIIRKRYIHVEELYIDGGRYTYRRGYNWRAIVTLIVALIFSVGGAYSTPGSGGPFPEDGFIPILKPLFDVNWALAFVIGILLHWALTRMFPPESLKFDEADRKEGANTLPVTNSTEKAKEQFESVEPDAKNEESREVTN